MNGETGHIWTVKQFMLLAEFCPLPLPIHIHYAIQ